MTDSKTLAELIARGEKDAPAIRAPERETMSFAGLQALCSETVGVLNGAGIGRGDRVAIVLPNSPEMATAFVSIAAGGTAAPLNPAYQAKEFEFYLSDLAAKAVIVLAGGDSPVIEAAGKLNIPLIPLTPDTQGPAGAFTLSPPAGEATSAGGFAGADDIALILHTSGTTSRPKIVPLSHANIAASARNISAWLELKPEDSCLNVMPLFHIHGLIAGAKPAIGEILRIGLFVILIAGCHVIAANDNFAGRAGRQQFSRRIHDRDLGAGGNADTARAALTRRQRIARHLMRRFGHAVGFDDGS